MAREVSNGIPHAGAAATLKRSKSSRKTLESNGGYSQPQSLGRSARSQPLAGTGRIRQRFSLGDFPWLLSTAWTGLASLTEVKPHLMAHCHQMQSLLGSAGVRGHAAPWGFLSQGAQARFPTQLSSGRLLGSGVAAAGSCNMDVEWILLTLQPGHSGAVSSQSLKCPDLHPQEILAGCNPLCCRQQLPAPAKDGSRIPGLWQLAGSNSVILGQ